MQFDEGLKKELNALTHYELKGCHAYTRNIIRYGIDALAHNHLMTMARNISKEEISLGVFIDKYDLEFRGRKGFLFPLEKIEFDGVFIPQHAYWDVAGKVWDKKVPFFDDDYCNAFAIGKKIDTEILYLVRRNWEPSDLENSELVELGINFGKEIWNQKVIRFNKDKAPMPDKIRTLGEALVDYYSRLILTE